LITKKLKTEKKPKLTRINCFNGCLSSTEHPPRHTQKGEVVKLHVGDVCGGERKERVVVIATLVGKVTLALRCNWLTQEDEDNV